MNRYISLVALLVFFLLPETANSFTRTWYQKAHVGGDARHRSTAFSIGNKGYFGGGHINSGITITYKDYWEYDPATNSWTQIADFGGGLRYHSSAFTIDDAAYVGCGENATHEYTNDFWKYVPEVNTWFPIADLPAIERRGGSAFAIDGKGYYGCGQSDAGYRDDFFMYDPETNSWTPIADFPGERRSAAVSFSYNGKGYLGTGHMTGAPLNDFFEYDPSMNMWTEKASVGDSIRQDAMAFCIDGKGYIGTGNNNEGTDYKDIWEYDFDADTWTQIADFGGQKRRYATTFVIGDTPYLIGGTDGTNFKDCWAYSPTVGILENYLNQANFKIYPNPSSDIINLDNNIPLEIIEGITVSVVDLNGRLVLPKQKLTAMFQIHKNEIGAGVFFLNLEYEGNVYRSEKIIFN